MHAHRTFLVVGLGLSLHFCQGVFAAKREPELIFEAVPGKMVASRYLANPSDTVIWNDNSIPWTDAHGNLIYNYGDRIVRLSSEGKIEIFPQVRSRERPLKHFFGIDTLDRAWHLMLAWQENDDAKQIAESHFRVTDLYGNLLKEVRPKWYLIPNADSGTHNVYMMKLQEAKDAMGSDDVPLVDNSRGNEKAEFSNGSEVVYSSLVFFDWYECFLDLDGRIISRSTKHAFKDWYGNKYFCSSRSKGTWTDWKWSTAEENVPTKELFTGEDFASDKSIFQKQISWVGANREGMVAFRVQHEDDPRWRTREVDFILMDAASGKLKERIRISWNPDTLKTSHPDELLGNVVLTNRNELIIFAEEYDPVKNWVQARSFLDIPGGGALVWAKVDSLVKGDTLSQQLESGWYEDYWRPEGGKLWTRIYKIKLD